MEAMSVSQDFIDLVAVCFKKETEKAVDVELKREDRRRKIVEVA